MANGIISRSDAKAQGLKRYFTGECCKRGHVAERSVAGCSCVLCDAIKATKYTAANRDEINERTRLRRANPETREGYLFRRRELRASNREKILEKERKARQIDPERQKLASRRHYYKNRDKELVRVRNFKANETDEQRTKRLSASKVRATAHKKDPSFLEKRRAYMRRYYREKPNLTASGHKRRALKRGSKGSHSASDLLAILKAQSGKCAYCRSSLIKRKKHVDHITPLSCGGSNDRTNIQYLCAPCNLTKGAKDPILFAQELGRLL